jgi:hypothetical protein
MSLVLAMLDRGAAATDWRQEFVLTDYVRIYDSPEQLVCYRVQFPGSGPGG